jgi:hypothetical protein
MRLNFLYSPYLCRGIFFLLIIFIFYFIFLFFERNSKENISTIVVIESELIKTLDVEKPFIFPKNRNPNFWKRKDWVYLGISNSLIKIIENYRKKLNVFNSKNNY